MSEIILNAWNDVLFNALKVWKWGFVESKNSHIPTYVNIVVLIIDNFVIGIGEGGVNPK